MTAIEQKPLPFVILRCSTFIATAKLAKRLSYLISNKIDKLNNNNDNSNQTIHAEISIFPIGTNSTSISKEVTAAFDAIRKTKDIKVATLTPMGTQIEVKDMRAILNCILAAHQAVKSTGAKRIVSSIRIAERLDVSRTLEDEVKSVIEKLPD